MFLIFGLALLQGMMLPDALGCGNCQTRINISAAFMMLSLNIAENIQDQETMLKGQDAGDLMGDFRLQVIRFGCCMMWVTNLSI